jgi:hypothetical protein
MKEPNWANCNEETLWKYVAWHLAKNEIDSVLVGGAVVSIYSEGLYKSGDLDILTYEDSVKRLTEVMKSIGFEKKPCIFEIQNALTSLSRLFLVLLELVTT